MKTREIITLSEAEKRGKIQTIRKAFIQFIEYLKENEIKFEPLEEIKKTEEKIKKDKESDFIQHIEAKNHIIGFASNGDHESWTKKTIKFFENKKCNIGITACRTKKGTIKTLKKWAEKKEYNISYSGYFKCFNKNENDFSNTERARMIVDRINYLLNQ